jgi:carbamoylphosphate synthase large subunit
VTRALLIVDAYSTGRYLASRIRCLSPDCEILHIRSSTGVPEELTLGYLNDFGRDLGIYQSDDAALENTIGESKVEHVIAGSEPGVELTDHLATRWKCPTRNVDALAASRRHKIAMQRRVKQVGLHTATSIEIRSSAEAKSAISSGLLSLPVVVKPPKSAGTDGVSICHNLQEMELSIEQLLNQYDRFHNLNDALLLQEFLYGEEYCVSAISAGGKHYFTDVWRYRKRSVSNTRVYECDELLDPAAEQSVTALEYSNSVLCAVGIRWGPSHTELMLTSNGPRLIEVAAYSSRCRSLRCAGQTAQRRLADSAKPALSSTPCLARLRPSDCRCRWLSRHRVRREMS